MGIETAILGLIGQYGLPVVSLVVVGWYLLKRLESYFNTQTKREDESRKYMIDRVEKSESRQEELIKMGRDISETNKILAEKFTGELGNIREEVNEIGNKVDIINVKLDKK